MNPEHSAYPRWLLAILAACALVFTAAGTYRLVWHTEREWVQLDQSGTGDWAKDKLVVPRVFDRRTGELCEYRGIGAKLDYTSQFTRGPWVCFPGPATN